MKIALIVDNPLRDLPGQVLLAMRLAQEGAACYLLPMYYAYGLGKELWTLAPDFVLYNYLRVNNQEEVRQALDAGIDVGVLDTEGGVMSDLDEYAQFLARDTSVRGRISCYCSWGTKLAEHARRQDWFGGASVVVTGTPRYDFYAPCWRPAALTASPHAHGYPQPLVLINGGFSLSNPQFQSPEREAESLVQVFGYDPDHVKDWQDTDRRAMLGLTALTNRLAARFPGASFVYRPHPFERLETYHELLDQRGNLHLVRKGTVDGWILRASAVLQKNCSTAIEAGLAGVPALAASWLPKLTATIVPAVEDVSLQCQTEEELSETLGAILAGRFEQPAPLRRRFDQIVSDWFHRADGLAHERAARCILESAPANSRRERLRNCRRRAYGRTGRPRSWRQLVRAGVVRALGLSPHWSFQRWQNVTQDHSSWRPEKRFTAPQVRALVDAIEPRAREVFPQPYRPVGVQTAQERGDYHFGYLEGQSVTVFPL